MDDDMIAQVKAAEERGERRPDDPIRFKWDDELENYVLQKPPRRKKVDRR